MRNLFIVGLLILSITSLAQERRITYKAVNKPLSDVFQDLEKEYGLHFSFSVKDISNKKATIEAEDLGLIPFLEALLANYQLTYTIYSEGFISVTIPSKLFVRFQLKDAETDELLPFATARINGTNQGYISNAEGIFELSVPNSPQGILELSFIGYEKKEISLEEADTLNLILLKKNPTTLKEIVVKEYLNKGITIDDQSSKISINTQEMEILPGLSERDLLLSTQILAGIGSADESASGLNVRGSSRDNTFIYWNSIPVYHSAHYFGNISSFIPSSIGKVDIFKNYIPVNYGGASSGLLLIHSRKPKKPTLETNFNLTHADVYASLPIADFAGQVSIAARRSFNDIIATPTFNSLSDKLFEGSLSENAQSITNNFDFNSKLIFYDFNINIDFETQANEFSISFLNSRSDLAYDSKDSNNFLQSEQQHDVNNRGVNFSWIRRWKKELSSEVSISSTSYDMDYALVNTRNELDASDNNDQQERTNTLKNFESRISTAYSPIENHVIDAGYQFNAIQSDLTFLEDFFLEERLFESIETKGNTHGLFVEYVGKFDFGLHIGMGLRQNIYTSLNSSKLDRQLRINYKISPKLLLKSSVGVYHQYVSSLKEEDFVFSNSLEQNWLTADDNFEIPLIKNEQVVLGAIFSSAGWVVDFDGYIKDVFAPLFWNFNIQSIEGQTVTSGSEQILGADLTVKKRWKYHRAWATYSFQDSQVEALEQIFPSRINSRHQFQFTQTLNYHPFEFSLGYTFKSGLPFTDAAGLEQVLVDGELQPFYEIILGPQNGNRLPNYHRVDLSVWYTYESEKKGRFSTEIGLSILNLFDTDNVFSRTFNVAENNEGEPIIFQRERSLIGLTPNLSIRLKF
ncbi:MAG: TonB-dependent receptor [Bacteroidota bacterium]